MKTLFLAPAMLIAAGITGCFMESNLITTNQNENPETNPNVEYYSDETIELIYVSNNNTESYNVVTPEAVSVTVPEYKIIDGEDGSRSLSLNNSGWTGGDGILDRGSDSVYILVDSKVMELMPLSGDLSYADAMIMDPVAGMPLGVSDPIAGNPKAGLLTAGEWHDHKNWDDYLKFIHEGPENFDEWKLDIQKRVRIEVHNKQKTPIPNALVTIYQADKKIFEGLSTADGSVAFFPPSFQYQDDEENHYKIEIKVGNGITQSKFKCYKYDDQTWRLKIHAPNPGKPKLDVTFLVDVTGSMGDELNYLRSELLDIADQVFTSQISDLRIGMVFYKDRGDNFITKSYDLSSNIQTVQSNMETMYASGGGDYPESMNLGLKESLQSISWDEGEAVRIVFLIADAPPHYYQNEDYTYHQGLAEAVKKGVKIIPVAASGVNKQTEYLMRMMAVQTQGRYIFITDDSGIGGSHIDPSIGEFEVETLNDIMVRTIKEELNLWPM